MEEKIVFVAEDGSEAAFYVLEETRLGGYNYLLVAESEDEEAQCLILKDISDEQEAEALYVPVEDETELDAVSRIFQELLDDGVMIE